MKLKSFLIFCILIAAHYNFSQELPATINDKYGEMVLVPAGNFIMGSDEGEENARPAHIVYLDSYYIDKHEVTNRLYAEFLNTPGNEKHFANNPFQKIRKIKFDGGYRYLPLEKFADHPVVFVTWHNAVAFAEWAGKRLPTEAEWEKAARGSDLRFYPWGNFPDNSYANYHNYVGSTTEVGTYKKGASPYGAMDMAGNVLEWVNDKYQKLYYSVSPSINPQGPGMNETGFLHYLSRYAFWKKNSKVLRGGSWVGNSRDLKVFTRTRYSPKYKFDDIGFRCAKSVVIKK